MPKDTNWTWLAIGLIVGIPLGIGLYFFLTKQPISFPQTTSPLYHSATTPKYQNKETWSWKDWKGRERKLTVEREVKTYA